MHKKKKQLILPGQSNSLPYSSFIGSKKSFAVELWRCHFCPVNFLHCHIHNTNKTKQKTQIKQNHKQKTPKKHKNKQKTQKTKSYQSENLTLHINEAWLRDREVWIKCNRPLLSTHLRSGVTTALMSVQSAYVDTTRLPAITVHQQHQQQQHKHQKHQYPASAA